MTTADWERIRALFAGAVARVGDERRAFLDEACAGDEALRSEVESLLAADAGPGPLDHLGDWISSPGVGDLFEGPGPGDRIGPYRIVRKVGEGGMGAVYEGERTDPEIVQRVALKLVRFGLGGRELRDRLLVERQILARLEHPNIARFLDAGFTLRDLPYLVMEYVEGAPIDRYAAAEDLDVPARLALFRTVCDAVQYAHQNLIVHRDLKPEHILITTEGAPKLLDFGIAKLLRDPHGLPTLERGGATRTAQRRMTLEYASPEQVRGEAVTPASDVYSLGVLLHVLLTDRSPYGPAAGLTHEMERAICEREPTRPSDVVASGGSPGAARRRARALRGDVDTIVLKALRKDPARRYATAGQMADDLRRHLSGLPVTARPDTLAYRAAKFAQRHRFGLAAAALVFASLVGGLGVALRQASIAAAERDVARAEAEKSRQISQFLTGLFEGSDPGVSLGEDVRALELLDRGAARLQEGEELRGQPDVRAAMLHLTAEVYQGLGRFGRAEGLAREALTLREEAFGASSVEAAETLGLLGQLRYELGDLSTSEQMLLRAVTLNELLLDPTDPQSLEALKSLAVTWQVQGAYEKADSAWRYTLALERRHYGDQSPEVAQSLHNLGWAWSGRGRYLDAERAFGEALDIRIAVRGEMHPDAAHTREGLATVLRELGRLVEAESLVRSALATQTRVLGDTHPDLANLYLTLGGLEKSRGALDSAEVHYGVALSLVRGAFDGPDVRAARLLNDLAGVFELRGDLAEADSLYREAWAIYGAVLGPDHPFTAIVLANVASLARRSGDLPEAQRLYGDAIEKVRAAYGPEHVITADLSAQRARVMAERGDMAGAEPLLRDALETLVRDLPATSPRVIRALEALVALYERWDRPEELARYQERLAAARSAGSG